jgi:hypothetical protein
MCGINSVQMINAHQARIIHHYKNTKEKLLKTNALVWFNKMCRLHHLTPKTCFIAVSFMKPLIPVP